MCELAGCETGARAAGVCCCLLDGGIDCGRTLCQAFSVRGQKLDRAEELKRTLVFAADCGEAERVKRLLDEGAPVNCMCDGRTPLSAAAWSEHFDVCKLLIESGADVHAKTPLYGCLHQGIVALLLDNGADPNARPEGYGGRTALHYAAGKGFNKVITTLVERGADINATDEEGRTPLDCVGGDPPWTSVIDHIKSLGGRCRVQRW